MFVAIELCPKKKLLKNNDTSHVEILLEMYFLVKPAWIAAVREPSFMKNEIERGSWYGITKA
jgi:hypothetical protein